MYAFTMGLAEDILLYDPVFTDFAVVFYIFLSLYNPGLIKERKKKKNVRAKT